MIKVVESCNSSRVAHSGLFFTNGDVPHLVMSSKN